MPPHAHEAPPQQVYSGRLGRTSKASVLISSHAGPVFPASVHTSVNVTHDEALRDAIAHGQINLVACPFEPGRTYALSIPVRYHDERQRLFALLIPESLRHEEFKHRSELLQELAKEREVLPDYVRNFHTAFSFEQLEGLIQARHHADPERDRPQSQSSDGSSSAALSASDQDGLAEKTETLGLHAALGLSQEHRAAGALPGPPQQDDAIQRIREQIEQDRAALEAERQALELERDQLAEVSSRLERERSRMEEIEAHISTERAEVATERHEVEAKRQEVAAERHEVARVRDTLTLERQQLEALKLNLEQRQHRVDQGIASSSAPEERTQVVTDDQFIEVLASELDKEDPEAIGDEVITSLDQRASTPPSASTPPQRASEVSEATQITQVPSLEHVDVSSEFDPSRAGAHDHYVRALDGGVVAAARASRKAANAVLDDEPTLFLQYALIEDYPVVVILLATLHEQQLVESFGWLLDLAHDDDRQIVEALGQESAVRFAFYDRQNKLMRTFDIKAPLEQNVTWIIARVDEALQEADHVGGFSRALQTFYSSGFERLGSMRHNFTPESFKQIDTPEQAKLAAGIVGYWSTTDIYEYLIGNRSFPISIFSDIQLRVIRAALKQGIYLNRPLRQRAIEADLMDTPRAIARRLMANFAEVSIGLKPSDLDPLEIWENWDALLAFADEVGAQPESDVVELAQASLRRAREFQQGEQELEPGGLSSEAVVEAQPSRSVPGAMALKLPQLKHPSHTEALLVAKRSEHTGVTYFLPDDAVIEQFDDLETLDQPDLLLLLDDPSGRLEASQVAIERFGGESLEQVLAASEEMLAAEILALAKFIAPRVEGIETQLVRGMERGGPAATYIATYALARAGSTSALPALLEALRDPRRSGNRKALAEALSQYGEQLLPALTNVIKRNGHDEALLDALAALEARRGGMLEALTEDRHRRVREAAKAARKRASN